MQWPGRAVRNALAPAALLAAALQAVPGAVRGQPVPAVPTSSLTNVRAIGVGGATVYVAGASGLYRASAAPYSSWAVVQTLTQQEAATRTIVSLAPHPRVPDDLLFVTAGGTLYRSTDGGRTATATAVGPLTSMVQAALLARSDPAPATIYLGGSQENNAVIYKSTDDGRTWAPVFRNTDEEGGLAGGDTITALTVDTTDPAHVLAGGDVYHGGFAVETRDGGRTWRTLQAGPSLAHPDALAINPLRPAELWASWSVMGQGELDHSLDGGHTWRRVAVALPSAPAHTRYAESGGTPVVYVPAIQYDTLSGRPYLAVQATLQGGRAGPIGVYTVRAAATWERAGAGLQWDQLTPPGGAAVAWPLALVAQGGYLVAGVGGTRVAHLAVVPVIGSRIWPVSAALRGYDSRFKGVQALGYPISPSRLCGDAVCQYFDKGRLEERSPGVYADGALVAALLAVRDRMPAGGTASTATYATLAAVSAQRTAPPPGFRQGTAAVPGGRFIPYSSRLLAAPGYVVPAYFWQYMNRRDLAPDGWLRDVGLPLTKVVRATVTKGAARRAIMLQAFQDALLTFDAQNPPAWRVERANSGADYARAFPQAVR